jgi:hypothetical protein
MAKKVKPGNVGGTTGKVPPGQAKKDDCGSMGHGRPTTDPHVISALALLQASVDRLHGKVDRLRKEVRGQKADQKKIDDAALTIKGEASTITEDVDEATP